MPERWKAVNALADPEQAVYLQSGHLSTIDRAQARESPPTNVLTTELRGQPVIDFRCKLSGFCLSHYRRSLRYARVCTDYKQRQMEEKRQNITANSDRDDCLVSARLLQRWVAHCCNTAATGKLPSVETSRLIVTSSIRYNTLIRIACKFYV